MNKTDLSSAKRVLVYRLGSLGDTVVALPSLHLIARTFPNAERMMLTNFPVHAKASAVGAVLGDSGLIHGYIRYTAETRNPLELASLWWKLFRYRPDVLVYLMPVRAEKSVRRDEKFFRLAGIRNIIGLPTSTELTHLLDESTGLYERESYRLARTIRALGDAHPEDPKSRDLHLTAAERDKAAQVLKPIASRPRFVCAPGTKQQANDWGQENWVALMRQVSTSLSGHALVLAGAKEDEPLCTLMAEAWQGESLNLCGQLSPRETAAVMEGADVFVGPDSGPMHLASAVGVRCAGVFSARNKPGIWFPPGERDQVVYHKVECFGCGLTKCIVEAKKCLMSVTVDEVHAAILSASRFFGGQRKSEVKG